MKNIFIGIVFVFSQNVYAAFSNYNSILPGDRSAGMGGAATALLGDSSSASFYNPATIAELQGSAFSAAVGVYKKYDTVYGQEEDFTKAPLRANLGFFRSLPASSGSVLTVGDYKIALSIVVPDYDNFKGDLKNTTENKSTLSYVDESLWVGGTIAKKLDSNSSLGLTIYYTARNYLMSVQDRTYSGTNSKIFTSERAIIQNALVPVFGYYVTLDPKWSLGVSLRIPAFPIKGTGSYFETYSETGSTTTNVNQDNLSAIIQVPGKLTVGFSYKNDPSLEFTGDLSLYEATAYPDLMGIDAAIQYEHKHVMNIALGMEKAFIDWFKVRVGVFSNMSAHPEVNPALNKYQADHIDMVGFSANMIFIKDKKIGYTFGGYYTGGRGKSIQRIDQQYSEILKTQQVFTMLVGTNFFF